jgi:Protein of unknown function (DUF3006)
MSSPVFVTGVVDRIEDRIATVLVGPDFEEWDFPLEMLPDEVRADSVLVLERAGRRLRFVEVDNDATDAELTRTREFDVRLRRSARKMP